MREKVAKTRTGRIRAAGEARREREKQELRDTILRVAGELFLEHGYEDFSLRQVAERIGYSPTTIYLYFRNKDDLLLSTVQQGFENFDRRLHAAAEKFANPLERLEALGRAYIAFGLENPALYRLMFMQRSDFYFPALLNANLLPADRKDPKAAASVAPPVIARATAQGEASESAMPRTAAMELLSAAVEEAMQGGLVPPSDAFVVADVLWAGAHGLVSLAISPLMSPEHAKRMVDPLIATLINGIRSAQK